MAATERITMTMRELERFKVIQDVADGKLKPWRAAERLELTTRQVRRLVARLREHGPAGLVSGHRAKPGNRRLDPGAADRALSIIRDRYADFGPTLACEKLWECHGIRLAKETVRKLMTEAGLWIPCRQRPPKVYQPRARRACLGELIQIDGSDHRWFEERAANRKAANQTSVRKSWRNKRECPARSGADLRHCVTLKTRKETQQTNLKTGHF